MCGGFEGMGWGWMGLGMAAVGLFWILVIIGIVLLVKWLVSGPAAGKDPLKTLAERYARGEISREQFEQMKSDLKS